MGPEKLVHKLMPSRPGTTEALISLRCNAAGLRLLCSHMQDTGFLMTPLNKKGSTHIRLSIIMDHYGSTSKE